MNSFSVKAGGITWAAGLGGSSNGLSSPNGFAAEGSVEMRDASVGVGGTSGREGMDEELSFVLIIAANVPLLDPEYVDVRSPIGDGGVGKAKDSEGANDSPVLGGRSWTLFRMLKTRY